MCKPGCLTNHQHHILLAQERFGKVPQHLTYEAFVSSCDLCIRDKIHKLRSPNSISTRPGMKCGANCIEQTNHKMTLSESDNQQICRGSRIRTRKVMHKSTDGSKDSRILGIKCIAFLQDVWPVAWSCWLHYSILLASTDHESIQSRINQCQLIYECSITSALQFFTKGCDRALCKCPLPVSWRFDA